MIDTVRFRVPISHDFSLKLRKYGTTSVRTDNQVEVELYKVHSALLNIGSYDYHVNLFVSDIWENLTIEFSLPKYANGHNLYINDLDSFKSSVNKLYIYLLGTFGDVVHPDSWEIQRLDVCYAWKFQDQGTAEAFLRAIQCVSIPKLKKAQYDRESVMFKGETLTPKFYLKLHEFFKHDYKRLKNIDETLSDDLLVYASGILRYEVTLRKKALQRLFEVEKLRIPKITTEVLYNILNIYFSQITKYMDSHNMTLEDIKNKITSKHSPKLARNLYLYYCACQLTDPSALAIFKQMADRSTLYRYDTYLHALNIPKVASPSIQGHAFTIPSIYGVRTA